MYKYRALKGHISVKTAQISQKPHEVTFQRDTSKLVPNLRKCLKILLEILLQDKNTVYRTIITNIWWQMGLLPSLPNTLWISVALES